MLVRVRAGLDGILLVVTSKSITTEENARVQPKTNGIVLIRQT